MPITSPPASRAPRDAASITPPMPPQTSAAPPSAIRRPTSSARLASSASGAPLPITAICGRRVTAQLAAEGTAVDALVAALDSRAVSQPLQLGLEPLLGRTRRAVRELAAVTEVSQL